MGWKCFRNRSRNRLLLLTAFWNVELVDCFYCPLQAINLLFVPEHILRLVWMQIHATDLMGSSNTNHMDLKWNTFPHRVAPAQKEFLANISIISRHIICLNTKKFTCKNGYWFKSRVLMTVIGCLNFMSNPHGIIKTTLALYFIWPYLPSNDEGNSSDNCISKLKTYSPASR